MNVFSCCSIRVECVELYIRVECILSGLNGMICCSIRVECLELYIRVECVEMLGLNVLNVLRCQG